VQSSRRPTEGECESDCKNPEPFWIFDFGFWIIGQDTNDVGLLHGSLRIFNPKSKIANPKFF
jgi:hypothetical protein